MISMALPLKKKKLQTHGKPTDLQSSQKYYSNFFSQQVLVNSVGIFEQQSTAQSIMHFRKDTALKLSVSAVYEAISTSWHGDLPVL